jgi:hypothetical protein
MPQAYKKSIVKPLLKNGAKDTNMLSSYRPVSNIAFLAKLIEKSISRRVTAYLNEYELFDENQHGFRAHHSCETALLCIHDAAVKAIDEGNVMLLIMLDLSAAFDMINHDMLLRHLCTIGFCDDALKWMREYLSQRYQYVSCQNILTKQFLLETGVPQGSVIGPLLFSIFISQIKSVFHLNSKIRYIIYADDIQLFTSCKIVEIPEAITRLESCIGDVKNWLSEHHLVLNAGKTEFMIFSSKRSSIKKENFSVTVDGVLIRPSELVRNLGVFLDSHLQLTEHVQKVCKTAYHYLRLIGRSRSFLTAHTTKILVNALAMSRIEYCSSLMHGITAKNIKKIQKVVKYGIRLVEGLKRRESTRLAMVKHKWLSASDRAKTRLAMIVHKAHYMGVPKQIASLIQSSTLADAGHNLRSTKNVSLRFQRVRTKMGERSFSAAAPTLWNALPTDVRNVTLNSSFKLKVAAHYLKTSDIK